jgi:hypothetical protein
MAYIFVVAGPGLMSLLRLFGRSPMITKDTGGVTEADGTPFYPSIETLLVTLSGSTIF